MQEGTVIRPAKRPVSSTDCQSVLRESRHLCSRRSRVNWPRPRRSTAVLQRREDFDSAAELEVVRLCGTPYEMGFQQGRQEKENIRRILRRYIDLAAPGMDDLPGSTAARLDPDIVFDPDQLDELQGIADAVEVPLANIVSHNLAIFSDLGTHCLQFAIPASRNAAGGLIHGMREQLPFAFALRECLVPLVQVRCPSRGIPSATFSFAGAVGGFGGINARGVAVTSGVPGGNGSSGRLPVSAVRAILEGRRTRMLPWRSLAPSAARCPGPLASATARRTACGTFVTTATRSRPGLEPMSSPRWPRKGSDNGDRIESLDAVLASCSSRGLSAAEVRGALMGIAPASATQRLAGPASDQTMIVIDAKEGEVWFGLGCSAGEAPAGFRRFRTAELLPPPAPPAASLAPAATPVAQPQGPGPKYDLDDSDEEQSLTHRFVVRMIDVPLPPNAPQTPAWHGPVLVVGSNAAAAALHGRLRAAGAALRTDDFRRSRCHARRIRADLAAGTDSAPVLDAGPQQAPGRPRRRERLAAAATWERDCALLPLPTVGATGV